MSKPNSQDGTDQLEQLVRETLRGDTVILVPPGTMSFILANLLLLIAIPALALPILSSLLAELSVGIRTTGQLLFTCSAVPLLVILAILVVRGHALGRSILRAVAVGIILLGVLTCVSAWLYLSSINWIGPAISVVGGLSAYLLLSSASYQVFERFFALRAEIGKQAQSKS